MPFALIFAGLLLTVAGVRGTHTDNGGQQGLYSLLKNDFIGQGSYTYWVIAILAIGSLGYIEPLRVPSRYMLALVVIVLILAQEKAGAGGFFAKFQSGLKDITGAQPQGGNVIEFKPTVKKLDTSKATNTIGELIDRLNGVAQ